MTWVGTVGFGHRSRVFVVVEGGGPGTFTEGTVETRPLKVRPKGGRLERITRLSETTTVSSPLPLLGPFPCLIVTCRRPFLRSPVKLSPMDVRSRRTPSSGTTLDGLVRVNGMDVTSREPTLREGSGVIVKTFYAVVTIDRPMGEGRGRSSKAVWKCPSIKP